jgi:poly-gamma-glutamate synthesis protein (capsule biosynthesis protein)
MVLRRLPGDYPGLSEMVEFIRQGDVRFVNMETTIHNHETYGAAQSGGTWLCSPPEVLEDTRKMGFNALTNCNNHALDYDRIGFEKTMNYVEKAGFPNPGVGRTLADAAAPVYIDTLNGRYAIIAACSTFNPGDMAGHQSRDMIGRPGINGVRYSTTYQLPQEEFEHLNRIAAAIGINGFRDMGRREGYLPPLPEDRAEFGELMFRASETPGKVTQVNPVDMARIEQSIREALYMADYVIVSMHSHEMKGTDKAEPDDFFVDFCHKCIDAGAHAVIGTGPHLLRPVEIYKNCPIFYCLGDFVIQLENIRKAPADMYEKQKMDPACGIDLLFDSRNAGGTRGLCYDKVMYEAIIPYWEAEDGKLTKLVLMPIELNFDQGRSMGGWPRPKYDSGILERLAKMSEPYGTRIEIRDGLGYVEV